MPQHKGLEITEVIDYPINFEIVFITAYSQYAIQAFKLSAFDYILKPIKKRDIQDTLLRLQARINNEDRRSSLDILRNNHSE